MNKEYLAMILVVLIIISIWFALQTLSYETTMLVALFVLPISACLGFWMFFDMSLHPETSTLGGKRHEL